MKKLLSLMLALSIVLSLCACGSRSVPEEVSDESAADVSAPVEEVVPDASEAAPEEPEVPALNDAYRELLDRFYVLAATGDDTGMEIEGTTGMAEAVRSLPEGEGLNVAGYLVEDLTGDGIPELTVGNLEDHTIFAVYTLDGEEAVAAFEGWFRNRSLAMEDGRFFYLGSGGAAFTGMGVFTLSEDGKERLWENFWFTDGNEEEMHIFTNTTGSWNPTESEAIDMTIEAFGEKSNELEGQTIALPLTAFAEYDFQGTLPKPAGPLTVSWAEDAELTDFDEFTADNNAAQTQIVFYTSERVTDFRIMNILLQDVNEDGEMIFSEEELYVQPEITEERPLLVKLTFDGDIPNYGVSYLDADGAEHHCAVSISGEDGSLFLMEY